MKNIFTLIVAMAFTIASNAQDPVMSGPHSIGLHAGSSTGLGLSYRYWPSKFGFQVTGIPIFNQGGGYFISGAITGLYELRKGDLVDFYGYFGNHFISTRNTYSNYDYSQGGEPILINEVKDDDFQYNMGLGIGFRCHLTKNVDFDLQGGYGIYDVSNDIYTFPTGEIGLYYKL